MKKILEKGAITSETMEVDASVVQLWAKKAFWCQLPDLDLNLILKMATLAHLFAQFPWTFCVLFTDYMLSKAHEFYGVSRSKWGMQI